MVVLSLPCSFPWKEFRLWSLGLMPSITSCRVLAFLERGLFRLFWCWVRKTDGCMGRMDLVDWFPFLRSQFMGHLKSKVQVSGGNEDRGGNIRKEERSEFGGLEIRRWALSISETLGVVRYWRKWWHCCWGFLHSFWLAKARDLCTRIVMCCCSSC